MLSVKDLMFRVEEDGRVVLVLGPVCVVVCDNAEFFEEWKERLNEQLNLICEEIKENHID